MATRSNPVERTLEEELTAFIAADKEGWEYRDPVARARRLPGGLSLWDSGVEIDSKLVAEMAPIIERHLDIKFKTRWIRPGGYASAAELFSDLLPKARAHSKKKRETRGEPN